MKRGLKVLGLILSIMLMTSKVYAMNVQAVNHYGEKMREAATSQNIHKMSQLLSDDMLVSMTKGNKTTTLNKRAYLDLIATSWAGASGYRYQLELNDVVTTPEGAKANLHSIETWHKDGQNTTFENKARITLIEEGGQIKMTRAISTISVR